MADLQERLQKEIAAYNALLQEEQELERQLVEKRDLRTQALGRARMAHEMLSEQLEGESLEASQNGTGDGERIVQPDGTEADATP